MYLINQNDIKITLKEKGKTHRVLLKNISYIQCESYLSTVYFINEKKPIAVAKLLKKFEEELSIYGFARICRNTLVNIKNVELIYESTLKRSPHSQGMEYQHNTRSA